MVVMAFRFRFMSLLKQRRYEFKQAQLALSRARRSLDAALQSEQEMREMLLDWRKRWQQDQARGTTVSEHLMARDYIHYLERELRERELQRTRSAEELQKRQKLLVECEKKVKMLELLEGKELQEFRYAAGQREQKQLDEMAGLRQKGEVER